MSAHDEYAKALKEYGELQKQSQDLSTKAQLDQLAENKKLVEAEKQNAFRGAYVDYAKNINPYGVRSELAYGAGLGGAGKGETAQANYYNTYQNRLGEINTNVTGQLRDIANQETTVRLAGDQAKLGIDATVAQQLALAKREDTIRQEGYDREDAIRQEGYDREDAIRQEGYDREDKANNKNYIMSMISSTGYTPSDEQLASAGMTRDEANALQVAYRQSLYSGSSSTKKAITTSQETLADIRDQLQIWRDGGNTKQITTYLDQAVLGGIISEDLADALYEEYIVPINTRSGQIKAARANASRTSAARNNVTSVSATKGDVTNWSYVNERLGVK